VRTHITTAIAYHNRRQDGPYTGEAEADHHRKLACLARRAAAGFRKYGDLDNADQYAREAMGHTQSAAALEAPELGVEPADILAYDLKDAEAEAYRRGYEDGYADGHADARKVRTINDAEE